MKDVEWLDHDELLVMRMFRRASMAVMSKIDADLDSATGLPLSYFELLWRLRRAPEMTMRLSVLGKQTASKPSRMTHAISVLERRGLVTRRSVDGDRRGAAAELTAQGLQLAEEAAPTYAESARRHLIGLLSDSDRAALTEILERVLTSIDPAALSDTFDNSALANRKERGI